MKNLVLIGMMGSSKTTVGKLLASDLNLPFCDGDDEYEKVFGESISETFVRYGETLFREREKTVYSRLGLLDGVVIACGGGVVLSQENMTALSSNGVIVRLTATAEEIFSRVSNNADRPLLKEGGLDKIKQIMAQREPLYAKYAHFTVDTTGVTPEAVKEKIKTFFIKSK